MITKVNCSSAGPERGTKGRLRKKKNTGKNLYPVDPPNRGYWKKRK